MVTEDWIPILFKRLCDSGGWISYGDPHVVVSKGEFRPQEESALLLLDYNDEFGELFFIWDPQLQVPSNVRTLYEQTIDSLNNHIDEFEGGFGQFEIDNRSHVLFSVPLGAMFEELFLITIEDINVFAEEICDMCSNMYLALLEVESGRDMDQVLELACARVVGRA
ncbi:hypothetical protein IID27_01530 [Patescibacteria group bacterium]|nr:hypothetical protein [Patescibacteria group bacterium]